MTVPSYTEEDVERGVAAILNAQRGARSWTYEKCMKAILYDLAARNRLVPPGSEVREEWAVWHQRGHNGTGGVTVCTLQECETEATEEDWARAHVADHPESHAEQRLHIVTPWSPSVPDTKESA